MSDTNGQANGKPHTATLDYWDQQGGWKIWGVHRDGSHEPLMHRTFYGRLGAANDFAHQIAEARNLQSWFFQDVK